MGESLLLITLVTLVVLTIRRGRPVVLDNPLVIERVGQYHLTFAPQLNQAQRYVEAIVGQFREAGATPGDLPAQFYQVRDPRFKPRDADHYLLAIAQRGGMLYIQAVNPQPEGDTSLAALRAASDWVLAAHPPGIAGDERAAASLSEAVAAAAAAGGIAVIRLHQAG